MTISRSAVLTLPLDGGRLGWGWTHDHHEARAR
jgi:hypothetical protein